MNIIDKDSKLEDLLNKIKSGDAFIGGGCIDGVNFGLSVEELKDKISKTNKKR